MKTDVLWLQVKIEEACEEVERGGKAGMDDMEKDGLWKRENKEWHNVLKICVWTAI